MNCLPPQNIDYERVIIAGLLINFEGNRDALDYLNAGDFYRVDHQKFFCAISDLAEKKEPVDLVTVVNRLQETGSIEGPAVKLNKISNYFEPVNLDHHCRKVRELSTRRLLINKAAEIQAKAYDTTVDFKEALDRAQADILAIDSGTESVFQDMQTLTMDSIGRYERKDHHQGIKTGIREFDQLTGGFFGSKLILICARPRVGKTAMMICMARNMAIAGHKVGIFSIEMDSAEIDDRFFAMEAGINSIRLSTGTELTKDEWQEVLAAAERKRNWPLIIDDTGGLSIGELKRRSRWMKKAGAKIIFIDQLSKITRGQGSSEYERKTDIVNQLPTLAKELRLPIVLLAQVNRNVEGRPNKAPTLGDLKATGSLEEDANMVFLGHREYLYTNKPEHEYHAQWELAKHRGGPTRIVEMRWNPKLTEFTDK